MHAKPLDPKRIFDVAVAGVGVIVTLPITAVAAVLVGRSMGRPVLFQQTRIGKDDRQFQLRKFRTMRPIDPSRGWTDDASRLTTLGTWLRSTSLDELPSLWNVLRGDMSLVGPRPLLPQYLDRYTPRQRRRHEVRPGLTGLAQVSGRNAISWEQRLELDVEYIDTRSFAGDLAILFRTVRIVLRRDGISASGDATMPEFLGATAPVVTDEVGP